MITATTNPLHIKDQQHCWHPFTQAAFDVPNLLIQKAQGIYLIDDNNQRYIDAISSWWVVTHGHNQAQISAAIAHQTQYLSHTLFSGITHPPAIEFATHLINTLQNKGFDFQWVFYSDNGSTAIEAALKMAVQYHDNQTHKHKYKQNLNLNQKHVAEANLKKRLKFLAFDGAYHGDTFGAMAVGKTSGFYRAFEDWLFDVDFIEYPELQQDEEEAIFSQQLSTIEENILQNTAAYLKENHQHIAAFIFEPIIQGASGMRFAKIIFLQKLLKLLKQYSILIIADEVMTGFGRTGKLFASEYFLTHDFKNQIDILCLSKGITGGFLAMGVTVVRDEVYQAFLSDDVQHAFLHGHSYTANPLACSAAIANLKLFDEMAQENSDHLQDINTNIQSQSTELKSLQKLELWQKKHLNELLFKLNQELETPVFKKARTLGGIAAFNGLNDFFELIIHSANREYKNYGSKLSQLLRLACLKKGVLLRPLGDCIYIMPPYCIQEDELASIYHTLYAVLTDVDFHHKLYNHQKNTADLF